MKMMMKWLIGFPFCCVGFLFAYLGQFFRWLAKKALTIACRLSDSAK